MSSLSLLSDKRRDVLRKESLENVYSSNSRLNLLQKRKKLTPLAMEASNASLTSKGSKSGDRYVTQRVLSAKTHRVKQLQNQLADAHYHLQELSNENRILKALQKKHEMALQRYENSNAELPTVLNAHNEEMRVQQTKHKQLKQQFKEVSQKLKERDLQLQQLRDEHQHLMELSKDRNLLEREKLQAQVADLSLKVQQQSETISTLQRRLALEAKNFRHQLQNEINKHKDTRHDLDLAITNADKLSTIIEMKEKMLSTAASRGVKSPLKGGGSPPGNSIRPPRQVPKNALEAVAYRAVPDDKASGDQVLMRLCENSRNVTSSMSVDEDTSSSAEARGRFYRSRTNSNCTITRSTPNQTRKNSKGSDDLSDAARTIQEGMADMSLLDDDPDFQNNAPEEVQRKMEAMKSELMNKIKNNEEPGAKKGVLKKKSTEESIEEQFEYDDDIERPKSRGRRTSFFDEVPLPTEEVTITTVALTNVNRENNAVDKNLSGKPIEKYCKDIMQDIEKSSKVIDRHVKEFSSSRYESEKLVQQLQAVDKINEYVMTKGALPQEAFDELDNNFKKLTDQVVETLPAGRKRSMSSRRSSKSDRSSVYGDSSMSNQDLLNDLLRKK